MASSNRKAEVSYRVTRNTEAIGQVSGNTSPGC